MSRHSQKPSKNAKDIRLATTSKIWSFATGMLAICIPLSPVTKSGPILPIAVVLGATLGTASVWKPSTSESTSNQQTSEKIKELEGRIANLETIITSEDINWQSCLESSPPSAVLGKAVSSLEGREKSEQIDEANVDPS